MAAPVSFIRWILLMPHKKDEPASQVKRTHRRSVVQRGSFSDAWGIATTKRAHSAHPFQGVIHALLQAHPRILLWRRSARKKHVHPHSRQRWQDRLRSRSAREPRRLSQGHRAVSRRLGRWLRVHVLLVLARRPLRRRRDPL